MMRVWRVGVVGAAIILQLGSRLTSGWKSCTTTNSIFEDGGARGVLYTTRGRGRRAERDLNQQDFQISRLLL